MKSRKPQSAQANPRAPHGSKPKAPELHLVEIAKPVYGGAFLARVEGKAIFVPLTLPGEQARIRITQNKSGYSTAEVAEILTASTGRIPPRCPHFVACGGCHYQHTSYETQLVFKQAILRETLERGGVPPPEEIRVLAASPWAYRNRIRLAFDAAGNPGYRSRRSHAVIPIAQCPIAAPLLLAAADAAAEILRRVPPNLRPAELSLFCDPAESALLVTFFVADSAGIRLDPLAQSLHERIPALQSAELAADGRPGHPPRTLAKWGSTSLSYPAAGFDYRVDHGAFFQVNRWLVDGLVEQVTAGQHGALAWDLFAGVGLFARKLTANFERVVAVESAPTAVNALEENLKGTSGTAVRGATLDFLRRTGKGDCPSLIVVDPPRTGLGAEITALLGEIAAPALVYVSCDPATLARDLRALVGSGYAIHSITLADLFPQTFHLETVVHLRRV
ncbi:MAG TPA: class I SAM-dependent RNA methyltransferase [Terracidiphilus sp.]|nr:class I SAM-dependent RNA methyltransferase [Terracidiphilus sp.]